MFLGTDANMVEVNPLILTKEKNIICLDAKVNFDSNALFRHPEIIELRDLNEEDPAEIEASKHDLAYIKLDGSIGCMVNGAGLAMATMDIIKLYGKEPANFLDVGGGASKEKVSAALKIILSDKNVKGILVNIFGGIMRCDVLAQGVVDAAKEIYERNHHTNPDQATLDRLNTTIQTGRDKTGAIIAGTAPGFFRIHYVPAPTIKSFAASLPLAQSLNLLYNIISEQIFTDKYKENRDAVKEANGAP